MFSKCTSYEWGYTVKCIGPLLFAMYINDLPTVYNDCKVKLYADDVKLYMRINGAMDRVTLQLALNAFYS
jgi:hypothetical protein